MCTLADEISSGFLRLKSLGLGINDELERQKTKIQRIKHKSEVIVPIVEQQTGQMKRILQK